MIIWSLHINARYARILVLQTMEYASVDHSEFQKQGTGSKKLMRKNSRKRGISDAKEG